jgi:hypothetical protein
LLPIPGSKASDLLLFGCKHIRNDVLPLLPSFLFLFVATLEDYLIAKTVLTIYFLLTFFAPNLL